MACKKAEALVPLLASRENTSCVTKAIKTLLRAEKNTPGNQEKLP